MGFGLTMHSPYCNAISACPTPIIYNLRCFSALKIRDKNSELILVYPMVYKTLSHVAHT